MCCYVIIFQRTSLYVAYYSEFVNNITFSGYFRSLPQRTSSPMSFHSWKSIKLFSCYLKGKLSDVSCTSNSQTHLAPIFSRCDFYCLHLKNYLTVHHPLPLISPCVKESAYRWCQEILLFVLLPSAAVLQATTCVLFFSCTDLSFIRCSPEFSD